LGRSKAAKTGTHVCPWWFAYTFDNFLRRLVHDPGTIFASLVTEGMTVLDLGCGMGYFSIGLAGMVGESGRVIAGDLQEKMLSILRRRAEKAGVGGRIVTHRCRADNLELHDPVDFALGFWMVHETPDAEMFFRQVASVMKRDARLLIAEPAFHVTAGDFRNIVERAVTAGLRRQKAPRVRLSRTALFERADVT
jgi:ubiquinone/menaquinone biosynthesis C-methylase UbiE